MDEKQADVEQKPEQVVGEDIVFDSGGLEQEPVADQPAEEKWTRTATHLYWGWNLARCFSILERRSKCRGRITDWESKKLGDILEELEVVEPPVVTDPAPPLDSDMPADTGTTVTTEGITEGAESPKEAEEKVEEKAEASEEMHVASSEKYDEQEKSQLYALVVCGVTADGTPLIQCFGSRSATRN